VAGVGKLLAALPTDWSTLQERVGFLEHNEGETLRYFFCLRHR